MINPAGVPARRSGAKKPRLHAVEPGGRLWSACFVEAGRFKRYVKSVSYLSTGEQCLSGRLRLYFLMRLLVFQLKRVCRAQRYG
jgi:hypothetical protein